MCEQDATAGRRADARSADLWGLLADAHGNPVGLAACIAALQAAGAGRFAFLGDAVGYLPREAEVLALLREIGAFCIAGNHEAMLLGHLPLDDGRDRVYGLRAARTRLGAADFDWIASWPRSMSIALGSGDEALLVHGGPADPWLEYLYPDSDLAHCASKGRGVLAVGQSHHAFLREVGATRVVNVGSCGLPRDVPGQASCALLDTADGRVRLFRVPFDGDAVLAGCPSGISIPEAVRRLLKPVPDTMVGRDEHEA